MTKVWLLIFHTVLTGPNVSIYINAFKTEADCQKAVVRAQNVIVHGDSVECRMVQPE